MRPEADFLHGEAEMVVGGGGRIVKGARTRPAPTQEISGSSKPVFVMSVTGVVRFQQRIPQVVDQRQLGAHARSGTKGALSVTEQDRS